jgi:RNA polymerase sigma-70 factor (ECF subfamily)
VRRYSGVRIPTVIQMTDFEAVYRQHLAAVFRYAVKVLGRRDIAEELTGDAFIALLQTFDAIDQSQLPGWLFRVVRNRAIDHWRRASIEQRYLSGLDRDPVAADCGAIDQWLDAAPALKSVHRACLVLRYAHGLERGEIAKRLGLSEMQVKGHLQYALRLLRRELLTSE